MKNLNSTVEGIWIETTPITLTEEQKTILESSDKEARALLITELNSASEVEPNEIILALAIANYNYLKPVISSDDTYELISCNISFNDNKASGILNCRVNGEHKQIRF
jgi:hypothetical protein